jgi:phosphate transport system ATP-binding protein
MNEQDTSRTAAEPRMESGEPVRASVRALSFWYGTFQALKSITLEVADRQVTAIIGASGCGKSTLLRCFNRMHDLYPGNRYEGDIVLLPEGVNIVSKSIDPDAGAPAGRHGVPEAEPVPQVDLRERGGGPAHPRHQEPQRARRPGRACAAPGGAVGRGQGPAERIRLYPVGRPAAAPVHRPHHRAEPEIILLDEPTSALDPIATAKIEELIDDLRSEYTTIIVTHSMQQAARVSNFTAFMHLGVLEEFGATEQIFTNPKSKRTQDYITGRFG